MKSNSADFGRVLVAEGHDERQSGDGAGRARPIDRPSLATGMILPPPETGSPGSRVTWQGFVDWMTARGA